MSVRQAVVTLYPLFQPDTLPFRSLSFASDSDYVDIGRSSKREAKNLIPAHHNACFDSRVMSRDHARFGVCVEKKSVYIRDGGSMHGTWVNDKKIAVNQDVTINSGDILTFGADVTRGNETFPPLKVRCEYEWFDSNDEEQKSNDKTSKGLNTFCVPDYDDDNDVVEVVKDSLPAKEIITGNLDSDDSDQSPDAEKDTSMENSTPATSPSNKEVSVSESKPTKPPIETSSDDDSDPMNVNLHSPIVLDGEEPLVTPRRTPSPIILNASDDSISDVNDSGAVGHDLDHESTVSDCPPPGFPLHGEIFHNEDLIDYTDYSDYEPNYGLASEVGSSGGSDSSDDESDAAESEVDSQSDDASSDSDDLDEIHQPETDCGPQTANAGGPTIVESKEFGFSNAGSIFDPRSFGRPQNDSDNLSFKPSPLQSLWPISKPDATPSSSLQPNEKPVAPRLPSVYTLSSNGWEPDTIRYSPEPVDIRQKLGAVSRGCTRHAPRPVDRQERPMGYGLSSHSNSNYVAPVKDDIHYADNVWSSQEPQQPDKPSYLGHPGIFSTSELEDLQAEREPNTRVSIADIVSPDAGTAQGPSLKRKAVDEEPDYVAAGIYTSNANPAPVDSSQYANEADNGTFSQDAQPQISMADLDTPTHLTGIHSIDEPKSAPEEVRPSKRVKAETQGRGFASHAATAIAGALVGGLGTVALLASLPPEYFA